MKKKVILFIFSAFFLFFGSLRADEGMWLVNKINSRIYKLMKAKGIKVSAKDIYDEKTPSLYKAVVAINGGMCSGSVVSDGGLMITNHHCAYDDVHNLSTPQNNYLENGFWAFKNEDEIPIKGKTVSFLVKVVNITDEANSILDSLKKAGHHPFMVSRTLEKIISEKLGDIPYEISVESFWSGKRYDLYFYKVYRDIRLVAVPPVSVAAFGGEYDNWGWPQQKCDFAMYRIYADKNGNPADYNRDNVPLVSPDHLNVSDRGVSEGDFTMVIGYPGRTHRYISAPRLMDAYYNTNPAASTIRRIKLGVYEKFMKQSPEMRLKYQDAYFGIENYCDYAKWSNKCIKRYDVIGEKENEDAALQAWINADSARLKKYGDIAGLMKKGYELTADIEKNYSIMQETLLRGCDLFVLKSRSRILASQLRSGSKAWKGNEKFLRERLLEGKDYEVDKEIYASMFSYCSEHFDRKYMNGVYRKLLAEYDGDSRAIIDHAYSNSIFTDSVRFDKFFSSDNPDYNVILNDPMVRLSRVVNIMKLKRRMNAVLSAAGIDMGKLVSLHRQAVYEYMKDNNMQIYPDANSTMRVTFGRVTSINPADGIYYGWQSTSDGIKEKYDRSVYEYNMKPDVYSLVKNADFGRWGLKKSGKLPVDFLSDNDITGGNSGSPVLDARGRLVGLAFDGNRESMAGDYYFSKRYCRCVNVDIRNVLWILDKYAHEDRLLTEMGLEK